MDKIERIKELVNLIKTHRDKFHNDQAEISDAEYDNLEKELSFLDPSNSILKPDSIGSSPNSPLTKVLHKIRMNSLEKVNTHEEFDFWFEKYAEKEELVWSLKVDGLSISADFDKGTFKQGVTRGDGSLGEDITHTLVKVNFAKKLKKPYTGPIRGEAYLTKKNFEKVNKIRKDQGEELFLNPRNAASGILRRLDSNLSEYLSIAFYQIDEDKSLESERLKFIESLGLETPAWGIIKNSKEMLKLWEKYENSERKKLDFDIDGLVIICNSVDKQSELGIIGRKPRFARAYKFSAESAVTQINSITPQVGRTGTITPVGEIVPVVVGGATLSRVTLHNYEKIKELGLKLNQPVLIERKGDVIPKITKALVDTGDKIKEPTHCPSCSKKLVREDIFLKCVNKECPEQCILNLLFWVEQLEIEDFGYKMVEKLFQQKKLISILDFYKLTEKDISELERSGDKIAKKLIDRLNNKRTLEPEIFVKALGVENLGEGNSKLILNHYSIQEMFNLTEQDLLNIHGIGPETAKTVLNEFKEKEPLVKDLLKIIKLKEKTEGKLSGKSFCFTGVRDKELEKDLKSHGAVISDSVNKALSYLIVLDPDGNSNKIEKAKKAKIEIIAIDKVREMFKV